MPHSDEAGSIEQEMIKRASHAHPNFRRDNDTVYGKLEEATRGTSYAPSIRPFQRTRNGRGAYLALVTQYAGEDKWTMEIQKHDSFLRTVKWTGTGNFTLERFVAQHRQAYAQLEQASQRVPHQLPLANTRVDLLLQAIDNQDARLQAAMAKVRTDTDPNGPRFDFEACAAVLLPADPVAKRLETKKRPAADISTTTAQSNSTAQVSALRSGIGKTGVHLRYHADDEYRKLSSEQKEELRQWRGTPEGIAASAKERADGKFRRSAKKKRGGTKGFENAVAKAVDARIASMNAEQEAASRKEADVQATVVSVLEGLGLKIPASAPAPAPAKNVNFLNGILKKAKDHP